MYEKHVRDSQYAAIDANEHLILGLSAYLV